MLTAAAEQLRRRLYEYYALRGYVVPTSIEAFLWATSEVGEASECLVKKATTAWIRNDPAKQGSTFSAQEFAEELGDAIMMLLMAGYAAGVDPILAMDEKMRRKVQDESSNNRPSEPA